jgi:hypothetical protein
VSPKAAPPGKSIEVDGFLAALTHPCKRERAASGLQLVLHLGAKPRPDATVRAAIPDPESHLEWKSADRATVNFRDLADIQERESGFTLCFDSG